MVLIPGMGCMASVHKSKVPISRTVSWQDAARKNTTETVLEALSRLDQETASSEKSYPAGRLAVVTAEIDSLQQEIKAFEESSNVKSDKDAYVKTLHQMFVSLNLYRRPMLASENEDFIANVNRKEMRQLEVNWLKTRLGELRRERSALHAQMLRTRALYVQLQLLTDSIWVDGARPGTTQEGALTRARALRDALASVSARLRAAAEYAHAAARLLDDALPAWRLASIGNYVIGESRTVRSSPLCSAPPQLNRTLRSGWERTSACADACRLLVAARCQERGARRVLCAPAAPRAARTLRLALDYAFTDAIHDHKYQRATEIFVQFKEALVQLVNSINQVSQVKHNPDTQKILQLAQKKKYAKIYDVKFIQR